jgi:hypothetical protein
MNEQLDPQNEIHSLAHVYSEEVFDGHLEAQYEERTEVMEELHGWPGDGSGEDDFADYNQNEANDYTNE